MCSFKCMLTTFLRIYLITYFYEVLENVRYGRNFFQLFLELTKINSIIFKYIKNLKIDFCLS